MLETLLFCLGGYLVFDHQQNAKEFQKLEASDTTIRRVIVERNDYYENKFSDLGKKEVVEPQQQAENKKNAWMPANFSL